MLAIGYLAEGLAGQILRLCLTVEILMNQVLEFVNGNYKHIDTLIKTKFYALVVFYRAPIFCFSPL